MGPPVLLIPPPLEVPCCRGPSKEGAAHLPGERSTVSPRCVPTTVQRRELAYKGHLHGDIHILTDTRGGGEERERMEEDGAPE